LLITAEDPEKDMVVKVYVGELGGSELLNEEVPQLNPAYLDYRDRFPDTYASLKIELDNVAPIPANKEVRVKITPIRNPPSTKALGSFAVYTGDKDYYRVEACSTGLEFATSEPGAFLTTDLDRSGVAFTDETQAMVGTKDVKYTFTLYLANDVPLGARVYVTWPSDWKLVCEPFAYTVECLKGACGFTADNTLCDTISNRL
jgi:hypothetical protein